MPKLKTLLFGTRNQVGRRLIVLVIAFSALTTLCSSAIHLVVEYRGLRDALDRELESIRIYIPSIAGSVWDFDDKQVRRVLDALILLPSIAQVSISASDTQAHWSAGKRLSDNVLTRDYPLRHQIRGADTEIGTLTVVASLDGIDRELAKSAVSIFLRNALETFLVALFMVYLIRRLITVRLEKLAYKVRQMVPRILPLRQAGGSEPQPMPASLDELDAVDWALDNTTRDLDVTVTALAKTNDELRRHPEHLEELVRERTAELREAQRIGHMGNWHLDLASGSITWSDEVFHIYGYQPGAIKPSLAKFMTSVHPDDAELINDSLQRAIADGQRRSLDHRIVLPNREVRWVHEEAVTTLDGDGRPFGMTGTVQDITERKQIEQTLIEAREAAEAANLAKSSFLSSMSHELRTPLNAVLGYAQLFAMDEQASRSVRENAGHIAKAGEHLLALVNDILDLARIESGRMEIHLEEVALLDILADCRQIIEPQAQAGKLVLELPAIAAMLIADRTRLTQALLNLLSNAVKYNRPGGHVVVHGVSRPAGRYRISITDNGHGIPAERIGELFQPFNRIGAERSSIGGTGIGLVITKTLVESMAGNIGVESLAGSGTTFWVELPLASGRP